MTIFFTFLNFIIWSNKTLIFILFIFSLIIFFKFRKKLNILNQERNTLLQEKEATIGFVQNDGEVFANSENIKNQYIEYIDLLFLPLEVPKYQSFGFLLNKVKDLADLQMTLKRPQEHQGGDINLWGRLNMVRPSHRPTVH